MIRRRRRAGLGVVLGLLLATGPAGLAEDAPALKTLVTIPLPDVAGRIDHLALDEKGKVLAVAALGNGTVEVIDLDKGKVTKRLKGLAEPQGIAFVPHTGRLVVTGGGDGTLRSYDGTTFEPAWTVDLGDDADNVRVEEDTERLFVAFGEGALAAVIDDAQKSRQVALAAHPEAFALEKDGTRVFVNVPGAGHVAVVDRLRWAVVATWPVEGAKKNYPMALDEPAKRLYVGCREPARLLAFDTTSGKVATSLEISGDVDDVWVDAPKKRIYLSCGEGFVDVVAIREGGRLERTGKTPTGTGARTSLFDPTTGRLYVALPRAGERSAEVRVLDVRD